MVKSQLLTIIRNCHSELTHATGHIRHNEIQKAIACLDHLDNRLHKELKKILVEHYSKPS